MVSQEIKFKIKEVITDNKVMWILFMEWIILPTITFIIGVCYSKKSNKELIQELKNKMDKNSTKVEKTNIINRNIAITISIIF